ncbi:MAG: peptidase, partial [Neobacillus sp.]|nr:peptidase [Neobacillus sp.]
MKKLFLFLTLFLSIQNIASARTLTPPPIPKERIAIVVLDAPKTEKEITQLLKPYSDIKLRRVFQEAIDGFSVEGNPESISQLARNHKQVINVSPVTKYEVQTEEGVRMIGGDLVRSFFDKDNHRLTGEGVTVGVIDTGVDYNHPDLRRNYGGGQ